jgi:hypothetical protein
MKRNPKSKKDDDIYFGICRCWRVIIVVSETYILVVLVNFSKLCCTVVLQVLFTVILLLKYKNIDSCASTFKK